MIRTIYRIAIAYLISLSVTYGAFPFSFWKTANSAPTYTLFYDTVTGQVTTWPIGNSAVARHYAGHLNWSDATARKIGRISFPLEKTLGTIVGLTYTCKIWTLSGTTLNAIQATSSGVAGSDAWATTVVNFDFPSPFTTTSSVNYAITLDCGSDDASNYASGYWTTPQTALGDLSHWDSTFALNNTNPLNMQMRMYTVP